MRAVTIPEVLHLYFVENKEPLLQFGPVTITLLPLLAAVLAVVLTLSVGAAVLVDWDDIFTGYFGPDAAETWPGC